MPPRPARFVRMPLAGLILWVLFTAPTLAAAANGPQPHAPGRFFLKLRPGGDFKSSATLEGVLGNAMLSARLMVHRSPGVELAGGLERLYDIRVQENADVPRLCAKLARLPEVEYAEPAFVYETTGFSPPRIRAIPNDPSYPSQQAHLAGLQVESAWDVQKSETGVPRPILCIVDGGTNWMHEDLAANIWNNPGEIPGNAIDDDANGFVDDVRGWNFRDNSNDPRGSTLTPSNANHGTHTAGLAAAVTDNGVGIAGPSWNPLLMPVNASGTNDRSIAYGYDGIIYAAENGADIVSLSWGGGGGSLALQDIIDFATGEGLLVVAAAGNNNSSKPFYPAAYRNVIAVANVFNDGVRYSGPSGSNYGGWLDVAAPGAGVYSTFDMGSTNAYGGSTGTSMSCPVAAGVAALIVAQNPTWGPLKVGEQLRVSCENINAVNPSFVDQLGKGRVNAHRAVTLASPAVRITSWTLTDSGGDGELNQGETVVLDLQVHNYHDPAIAPSFTLSTTSPHITINDNFQSAATLMEDTSASLPNAFAFTVSPSAPPGTLLDLRIDIAALGYTDFQYLPIVLEPVFETHDVNEVHVSLTATGGIGWVGFPSGLGDEGDGFTFQGGPNLLFEGALLLGTGPAKLSDAARLSSERTDFVPVAGLPPQKFTPGVQADQEIRLAFTDSINTATPLGVRVDVTSWAAATPPNDDFVIVAFEVTNRTASPLDSLWAGLFFDWDIDELHYATNRAAWDAGRRLGYAWDASPGLPYVGVLSLSGAVTGYSAIPNNGSGAPWSLIDGFSKAEKWDVLQGGTGVVTAGPTDISNALSSGPYAIAVGASATAFFALLAGENLADLQANADRAVLFFADSITTEAGSPPHAGRGPAARLGPPTPNPFNPSVRLDLELQEAREARVGIYDARGRRIVLLTDDRRAAGRHPLVWDGRDTHGRPMPSGVYFARLESGGLLQVRRLVLMK